MKLSIPSVLSVSLLLLSAIPASATIIYNTGAPSTTDVLLSDVDASASGNGLRQQIAGFFQLEAGASTIEDIHWSGIYPVKDNQEQLPLHDDDFWIRIFSVNGSTVDIPAIFEINVGNNVGRTDSGADLTTAGASYDIFSYWVDIDPLVLVSGEIYALSILNDTTGFENSWSWSKTDVTDGFNEFGFRGTFDVNGPDGQSWSIGSGNMSFHLTVPEPATFSLLLLALTGLGYQRRRAA